MSDHFTAKNPWYKKVFFGLFVIGAVFVLWDIVKNTALFGIMRTAYYFAFAPKNVIQSNSGRVNILVLGKSGSTNAGTDLTDTMMLVSVSLAKPDITVVSIPRDLWIPEIRAKINSAYYWGENGSPYFDVSEMGGGLAFAEIVAGMVAGQPVQYGVVVDFSSFKDIIDAIGGIGVNVERGFTDSLYPIAGREKDECGGDKTFACRYQTISFNAGVQNMDGETALKFVRSRHAEGIEGTDIAREARQQKVIDAIRDKISNPKVFLSPKTDWAMINIVKKYIETDITPPTAGVLARKILQGIKNINQFLLPQDLLINPPLSKTYDNQYVFIPKAGNGSWEKINGWFSSVLNSN
jgi:LCP family protein required for cell wall assembly